MKDFEPKQWTESAVFCYKRGCKCSNCYIKDIIETRCNMKSTVIELVRTIGTPPPEVDTPYNKTDILIIKAILEGAKNKYQIAKMINMSEAYTQARFSKLYEIARKEGFVYFDKRYILPEYILWVRENRERYERELLYERI